MKLIIDTTPDQDAALTVLRDQANIGQGDKEPTAIEDFALTLIDTYLSSFVAQVKQQTRDDIKRQVDSADDAKLAAIAAAAQ